MSQAHFRFEASDIPADWAPPPLPSLQGVKRIALDSESTGLRWFGGDKLVGFSACLPDGETFYAPVGHAGGNLDEEATKRWCQRELRDLKIDTFNGPYEINVFKAWGIDLEAQGCTFSDAGHWAALLNDHRYQSSLESICQEYLKYGKRANPGVDRMADLHAFEVVDYARWVSRLVHDLRQVLLPKLSEEDLLRVLELEDECLPATAEMMWNGSPIDEELLDQWLASSEIEYIQTLWDLRHAIGFTANPNSPHGIRAIFDKCGLAYPKSLEPGPNFGKVTFEKRYLAKIDHPTIRIVRRARRLYSLRNKYLIPYKQDLKRNGILRYSLHQLRSGGDDDADSGTISGRYSSSAYGKTKDGVNIQQVAGKKFSHSVKEEADWPYQVRKLFIPRSGMWGSYDADQIEYRLFAHYGKPAAVMAAYAEDPKTNFHKITQKMIEAYTEITYELTKDCNFAGLYGAGLPKFAFMIGIDKSVARPLYNAYHRAVPEIRNLMDTCIRVAEERGFVRTILGRRARFPFKDNLHKALNRVIQGSAADEMKTKIVALRKAKTGMVMRFVVHDEVNGDLPHQEAAEAVHKVLNTQMLETRVPLLWSMNTGPNWQECRKVA